MNNQTKPKALYLVAQLRKGYRSVLAIMTFFKIYFLTAFILNLFFLVKPYAAERGDQRLVPILHFAGIIGLANSVTVIRRFK